MLVVQAPSDVNQCIAFDPQLLCQAHSHSHHLCLQEFGSSFSPLAAKELLAPALAEYIAGEQHKRQLNLAANGFPWEEGVLQSCILQKSC